MKVWELNITDIDFSTLHFPEEGKIEELQLLLKEPIDINKLKKEWDSPILLKSEQKLDADFYELDDIGIIITSRAVELIETILLDKTRYELLPFISDDESYYLLLLTKDIDCLVKESSSFDELPTHQILTFDNIVFDNEKIEEVPIFTIPEMPYCIFITHTFKIYYERFELKGIDFNEDYIVYKD